MRLTRSVVCMGSRTKLAFTKGSGIMAAVKSKVCSARQMNTPARKEKQHAVLSEKRLGKSTLGRLLLAHKEKPFTSGLRVAPAIGEKGSK